MPIVIPVPLCCNYEKDESCHSILRTPCVGLEGRDAIKMVAILGAVFAIFYIFHGAYLCKDAHWDQDAELPFGIIYFVVGLAYWSISCFLWIASDAPSVKRFRIWIGSSVILLFATLIPTLSRSLMRSQPVWSANVWILSGAFLQCFMTWVVWASMMQLQDEENMIREFEKHNADLRGGRIDSNPCTSDPTSGESQNKTELSPAEKSEKSDADKSSEVKSDEATSVENKNFVKEAAV